MKSNFQKIEKKYEFHEISIGETVNIDKVNVLQEKQLSVNWKKIWVSWNFHWRNSKYR